MSTFSEAVVAAWLTGHVHDDWSFVRSVALVKQHHRETPLQNMFTRCYSLYQNTAEMYTNRSMRASALPIGATITTTNKKQNSASRDQPESGQHLASTMANHTQTTAVIKG